MFRKATLLFMLLAGLSPVAFARRIAPSFESFEVVSNNGGYRASVDQVDGAWILSVFPAKGDELLWSCAYDYTGYPGGYLSDDGHSFVSVHGFFEQEGPLVWLYTDGQLVVELDAAALEVQLENLPPAVCICSQGWVESAEWQNQRLVGLAQSGFNHRTAPVFVLLGQDGLLRKIDPRSGAVSICELPRQG